MHYKIQVSCQKSKLIQKWKETCLVDNLGLTSLATDGDGYRLEAMCTSIELLCVESDNLLQTSNN
jgi:hypothetical protein